MKAGETLQSRSSHVRHLVRRVQFLEIYYKLPVIGLESAIFGLLVRCYTIQRLVPCSQLGYFTVQLGDPCS